MQQSPQTYFQTPQQGYVPFVQQATPFAPYHQQIGGLSPQVFGGYGYTNHQLTPIPMGGQGQPGYSMAPMGYIHWQRAP